MKLRFSLTLIVLSNWLCYSQNEISFGNIPTSLLEMKVYDKDTTANAVVIYEKGISKISKNEYNNVRLTTEYTARIKIINKNGLHKANVEILLNKSQSSKSKEVFKGARAVSINSDRTNGSLNKNDIHIENYNDYYDIVKFTIPNVKPGAVIDYTYVIESPFFYNFNSWKFQSDIPKVYSEFYTSIPANYKYNIKLTGPLKLDVNEQKIRKDCFYFQGLGSADCTLSTFAMKDIPAFKVEDYMTSKYNYLAALDYELETFENFQGQVDRYTKSWRDTDKEFKSGEEIGKQARKEKYFEKLIPNKISNMPMGIDKAKKIYYWLQAELFWNKKNSIFYNVDVKDAYDRKSGSSTELNLILLNTLKASGYNAEFMLISTRENGLPTKLYPVISEFNYLIIKLNYENKSYLLDITNKSMAFGMIPFKALNSYGRVFDLKNESYWYEIKIEKPSLIKSTIIINIKDNNQIEAKVRRAFTGYKALSRRNEINNNSEDELFDKIQETLDKDGMFAITNYTSINTDTPEEVLLEEYDIKSIEELKNSRLILNPFIIGRVKENPFTLNERLYPVDFGYPLSIEYAVIINFTEQCSPENLPKNNGLKLVEDRGYMVYNITKMDNKISINNNLKLQKSSYYSHEYEGLKKLFTQLVFLQNNQPLVFNLKTTK